jgi:hypothetical protein
MIGVEDGPDILRGLVRVVVHDRFDHFGNFRQANSFVEKGRDRFFIGAGSVPPSRNAR